MQDGGMWTVRRAGMRALRRAVPFERFAAHRFVQYALLDIDLDPRLQGYGRHAHDVVLATNALHASGHIQEVQRACECAREPLGRLPASDGGREEGVRRGKKV